MKTIFQFVSTNVLSGLENVVINICTLVKGYKFVYVSPSGPINYYLNKYNISHVSVKRITPNSVRHVIKKYKPDIVHGHDVKASLCLACNFHLCHKNGIKIISELHNDDPRMWKISLRSLIYAMSVPFYDHIVMISLPIYKHYIFKRLTKNKVIIIDNIVNIHRIYKNDLFFNRFKQNKKWDCIFIGRLVHQKDPIKFINAIYYAKKKNNGIRAIMLGEGPLYYKLINLIKKLDLDHNIFLLGFKSDPYKYLRLSKICIIPSVFEGFGLVALESLIIGTPVISTNVGGLKHIIDNHCGEFATSALEFSNDICGLLSNNSLYDDKVINSLKKSKTVNNMHKFVNLYFQLYNSK